MHQVPRALIVSALAAALDFGLLVVFVEFAGWNLLWAAALSYSLGGVLQYVLCAIWVFPAAPKSVVLGFTALTLLSLVGLAITWATIVVLSDLAGIHYALAKVVALALSFCWNFLSRKRWIFHSRR